MMRDSEYHNKKEYKFITHLNARYTVCEEAAVVVANNSVQWKPREVRRWAREI